MNHRAWIFSAGLLLGASCFPLAPASAQLFGPSDEEVAREKSQDDQIAQLTQQLSQLQEQDRDRFQQLEAKVQSLTQSLSQATGANEELNHQLSLLNDRLDRQQKDFSYRLCMLSAQQLGAAGDDQGLNCAAAGTTAPPPQNLSANRLPPGTVLPPLDGGGDAPGPGRPPGSLGTLPSGAAVAPAAGASQFDTAMNLLAKAQYAEASAAFRAYADAHPDDDDLSAQSVFWIGNIAFIRQDYPSAARSFAELLKKYPDSGRAPDGMLKLGQSLLAQGQTSGGCTTLGLLKTKYPKAPAATLAAAAGARKASCGK
jgi:tol-pal system protein YbgF